MSDVFISYSRKNSPFARRLIDKLTQANKDAWVDWEGIPLTSPNWWAEIKAGIEGADSFVFILSPDSMASVVCNMELDYAIELKKRIIPVVYQDVVSREAFASIADFEPDKAMEERLAGKDPLQIARDNWQRLSHINWVFFRESDDFEEAFKRLATTVETDLPYVKAHTRLLTRALEWQRGRKDDDLLLFGSEIDDAERWLKQAETYLAQAQARPADAKQEVVNPLPEAAQRDYIAASRKAQQRRRLVAGSGVLVAAAALVFAIGATLLGVQATNSANEANNQQATAVLERGTAQAQAQDASNQQATATRQVATAVVAQGTAQAQAQDASNQQATATRQVATAVAVQATAENQAERANTQVAVALVTVTQAAIVENIVGGFANAMLRQRDTQQIALMDAVVAKYPDQARAYQMRGLAYAERGDPARAIADYDEGIRLDSNNANLYINRGDARLNQGDLEGAITDYSEAIRLNPQYAEAYNNRGVARYQQGDLAGAIADYDEAIRINPDFAAAHNNRGNARYNQGDLAGAIADYDEAIRLDPDDAEAYYNRGNARYNQGDLAGAIADHDEAIRLNPDLAQAYNSRGLARQEQGDLAGAIADYDEAIRINPDFAAAHNNRGNARRQQGDLAGAIADHDEAIRLNPDLAQAYYNRGNARAQQGDLEGAIADYTEAIRLNPDLAQAYTNRGNARAQQGDLEGAIADHDEAIRIDPQFAEAYYSRGAAYQNRGDLDGAIADYTETIRIDPNNSLAYYYRALARYEQGDLERAIADYDEAIRINPQVLQFPGTHYNLGNAHRDEGDLEVAIFHYNEAIRINPQYAEAYADRGVAYYLKAHSAEDRRANLEQALADWRMVEQLGAVLPQGLLDFVAEVEADLGGRTQATVTPQIEADWIEQGEALIGDNRTTLAVNTIHLWRYEGQAGETLVFTTVANWNTVLILFGENLSLENDDAAGLPNNNSRITFTLPASGTYFIGVTGYYDTVGGEYSLRVESSGRGAATTATSTPASQSASQSGPSTAQQGEAALGDNRATLAVNTGHLWTYEGQAGETLTLTTVAEWDTVLLLGDPEGQVIARNDDTGKLPNNNSQITFNLPVSGQYLIRVDGFNNAVGGEYTLRLETAATVSQGEVRPEDNSATLAVNTAHLWTYTGQAGETLSLTTVAEWDTVLILSGPNGRALAQNDDADTLPNNNSQITFVLSASGSYSILVSGFGDSGGEYTLRVASEPPVAQGEAAPGNNQANLAVNTAQLWTYAGQAGETLTLTTVAEWDTVLDLLGPDGEVIVRNDDAENLPNNNSRIIFTLSASGSYSILVSGFGDSAGEYTLRVESSNERPSAAPQITRNAAWTPVEREFSGITFVLVPAGCFMMGNDPEAYYWTGSEFKQGVPDGGQQCFDEPFWISKTEVTNAQYGGASTNSNCTPYSSASDQPRNCVDWFESQAFCEGLGGRLPTESEWEYAARGPSNFAYPWGNDYDAALVIGEDDPTYGDRSTAPVGSKPAGASWVGALDMSGNVWEWTLSAYQPYPYVADDGRNMTQDNSARRALRGGSFYVNDLTLRAAYRFVDSPDPNDDFIGFRCALRSP